MWNREPDDGSSLGEVVDETEEQSKDRVDGFGDRSKGLCDVAAMASGAGSRPDNSPLLGVM